MSNNRYLEVDSTYRDRVRWPLPGLFEIPISQTGRKGRYDALDPVSLAAPIAVWTSSAFDANTPGTSVAVTVDTIAAPNLVAGTNSPQTFIIEAPAGDLQQARNYYINAIARNTTIGPPREERRIVSYRYLGTDSGGVNDRAEIVVEPSFGSDFADGDSIEINDPTDLANTSFPLFFVPSGRIGTNSYIDCILYNETLNQYRSITGYDFYTHLLEVDTSGTAGLSTGPVTGWMITDDYSIRKQPPAFFGTAVGVPTERVVPLSALASMTDDFYNRFFLRMTSGVADNEVSMIIAYDGATQTATLSPGFSVAPAAADTLEILPFSYDNAVPFVYSGSLVSQQEEVCYEIELLNLVLPNDTLVVGQGSRIAFYPYVYVELTNVSSASAGMKNIIYSNNPNSTRMLFRAAIDDVQNPIISSFIKVDGDGMVQTVKFKPNDNLRFSVRLSNGDIYDTIIPKTSSPFANIAEGQISALFSLKRL